MTRDSRSLTAVATVLVCLVIAGACNRDLTAPQTGGALHVPQRPSLDVVSSLDQITATTTGVIDNWHGKENNANPSPIATFPTATWYRVDASGLITMTPDPRFMPGQPTKTYGPTGNARFTWSYAGINTTVVIGNATSDSTGNSYVQMSGSLASADRPGYAAVVWGPAYCGPGYTDPCGTYAGPPTTFTFTRLNADLTLTADSTTVAPGSTVTFSYGASPTQVEGQTMPVVVDSVRWTPDTSGAGAEKTESGFQGNASACNSSTKTCTRQIVGSGTFTLIAWVNGKAISKSVHIQTPSLSLTAVVKSGVTARTVTFTPQWSDGATVAAAGTSWTWAADTLTGQTVPCTVGHSPCTTVVWETGTMTVTVTRNGVHRTARARATAVDCPVSDSILNDPAIRKALMKLIQDSGPDLAPGDGIANGDSVGNKREHAGWIFKTADGDYYFVEDSAIQSNAGANECYAKETDPNPHKRNPTDVVALHVHTHPTHKGKKVYGCPPQDDGTGVKTPTQRGPWDSGRPFVTKRPEIETGGGSLWGDWIRVVQTNRDEFVVTADGEVWRLPSALMFSEQSSNRLSWKYSGNSDAACNW